MNAASHAVAEVIRSIQEKGVRLWSENGALRYAAPKGVLTSEEKGALQLARKEILALLDPRADEAVVGPKLAQRPRPDRAPLTFSQWSHWHAQELARRPSVRHLASATRLVGPLRLDLLSASLTVVIARHEALRTRIAMIDESPVQLIAPAGDTEIQFEDYSGMSPIEADARVAILIDRFLLEPVRVSADPLLAIRVAKLRPNEHVLVLAMEHMICDAFSLNLLQRELLETYAQSSRGVVVGASIRPLQFADYAFWQRRTHSNWLQRHGGYWNDRLRAAPRLNFPDPLNSGSAHSLGREMVPVRIGAPLKRQLEQWCRQQRTTLVMGVFTAFVAAVLRWCGVSEAVIRYQTDGRASPEVQGTIGFFASVLHLRLALGERDRFVDLLERVTQEYCTAHEHADSCYIDAQMPRAPFTANPAFNWVSQEPRGERSGASGALVTVPHRFAHPALRTHGRDVEPSLLLYDANEEIFGGINYPIHRFSRQSMERFQRNFIECLQQLLTRPQGVVADFALVA